MARAKKKGSSSVKRRSLQIIILLLVLILLAVTNPSKEKHQEAVSERIGREVKVPGSGGVGYLYSGLFDYRDYVFFSITRFEGKLKSFGIGGLVVAF